MNFIKKLCPYLPRIVAWLLVLNIFGFDLFGQQTVFLLDYVPTPVRVWDWSYYLTIPWIWIAHDALLLIFWYIWWSKIYLLSIVAATLWLWYVRWQYFQALMNQTLSAQSDRSISRITIIMMVGMIFNPMFSSRMQTQPGVWLGIVLLGRWIYRLWTRWSSLRLTDGLIVGVFWWLAMMSMNHASFMIALLLLWVALLWLVTTRTHVLRIWWTALVITVIVWLLNANWIIAWLTGTSTVVEQATSFSQQNIEEFMTYAQSGLGPVMTSVLWYWFWWEKYGSASAPAWSNPRRRVAWLLLFAIAIYGWWRLYIHSRQTALLIMMIMMISVVLGVGIASDWLAPAIQWLYDHVPGYRGLREPHKRIWLYMMILVPLLWYGRTQTYRQMSHRLTIPWYAIIILLLLFARTPWSFAQMNGRYIMTDYPASYDQTRSDLMAQWREGTIIQLPWHSYQKCQRSNKVISNSLRTYMYPISLITSDNIEVWQLYTNSNDVRSRDIEEFIRTHDLSILSKYNISWIMYTNLCADFKRYEWIEQLTGLEMVIDHGDMKIYEIKARKLES